MDQFVQTKVDAFFHSYPLVRIQKGQALLLDNEKDIEIFWIRRGMIRMYQITEDGTEMTLHLFTAPAYFPMMFYLSYRKSNYFYEAVEEVIARKAPGIKVEMFLKQNPDVLFDLSCRFADAITGLLLRIEQLSSQNTLQRVSSLLLYLSHKFGKQIRSECIIDLKLSHEDIAKWIGAARETISHQIEKLTDEGIIVVREHRFVILDRARLEKQLN